MAGMRNLTITLATALATLALAARGAGSGATAPTPPARRPPPLAACGAGSDDAATSASSAQDKAFDGALKFARCMRGQGIDFPDPREEGSGLVKVGGGPGQNPDDPRTRAAADK